MTDKILYLLNRDIIYLGFAKYLQEKHEVEQYAIIETNKGKNFFENQKIVNFEKIWFYNDCIKNLEKIDMDYLVNFEKKYKINLWNLIYGDRHFYRYNKYNIFIFL